MPPKSKSDGGRSHDEALKDALAERKAEREAIAQRKRERNEKRRTKRKIEAARKKRLKEDPEARARARKKATAEREANETPQQKREREAANAEAREEHARNVIERELARRELCRRRLIASTLRFNLDYLAGWVHKDICSRLEKFVADVIAGKSPRLMIQMPPRHGKSQIASVELPAWFLGNHPNKEVILCSYSASLALDFSRQVRERLRDKEYQVVFEKTRLDKDNQNAEGWRTTKHGGFLPAGVGGPITGKGCHILIIDDPIKNSEEAESETTRESIKNWYRSTAYTRLAPGAGVLIIQTRWHDDDLSGWLERLMQQANGDMFEIIRYPAIALEDERYRHEGDALHPARYPEKELARIETAVGPRIWSALYQQSPVLDDGAYFQRQMFQYYTPDGRTEDLTIMAAWDLAIGQKQTNDYSVGVVWGRGYDDQFYILEMRRGRWDAFQIVEELCDMYMKWRPDTIGVERGVISQSVGPYLDDEISRRRLYGMHIEDLMVGKRDKMARARTIQGLMRQGRVYFPDPLNAPWVTVMMNEMLRFPHGVHDDIVDAMAWLGLMLGGTSMPGASASKLPPRKSWRDRLTSIMSEGRNKSPMSS